MTRARSHQQGYALLEVIVAMAIASVALATIYRTVGISPRLSYEIEKRPFYVTRDGQGKPIQELLRSPV